MTWHRFFFSFFTWFFKNIRLTERWTHYIAWNSLNLAIHTLWPTAKASTHAHLFLPFTFYLDIPYSIKIPPPPSITMLPVGMNADREFVRSTKVFEVSFPLLPVVFLQHFTLFPVCVLPCVWSHMYCCYISYICIRANACFHTWINIGKLHNKFSL